MYVTVNFKHELTETPADTRHANTHTHTHTHMYTLIQKITANVINEKCAKSHFLSLYDRSRITPPTKSFSFQQR